MVINNLRKTVEYYRQQLGSIADADTERLELLRGLPFYCDTQWLGYQSTVIPIRSSNFCCFNHTIGLPKKDGNEYPLFDYELQLFNALANYKYVWVKKSSGLGVTEFMLRYMAWLATKDNTYGNTQFPILCGPNQDILFELFQFFLPFSIFQGVRYR